MPKKDTSAAVLGMLSSAGAQTRAPRPEPPAPPAPAVSPAPELNETSTPVEPSAPEPAAVAPSPAEPAAATVSTLPTAKQRGSSDDAAPRTLRLRPDTATRLRSAWLEAKRDDVLLTAQDFASDLVEDALMRHRRRRATNSS
jgi:hypothetical protein